MRQRIGKKPLPFGASSAASLTLERRKARAASLSLTSMRNVPIAALPQRGDRRLERRGVRERRQVHLIARRAAVDDDDVLRDGERREAGAVGCRPRHARDAAPGVADRLADHQLVVIVVERERQPVVGVGVDHGRAEAEAVVEELDERIRAGVGGAAAGVAAAAGDAEQPVLVERRAGQVVQAGVVALHVLHVGEIPGVADHGGREVAAALDVGVEHAHHRRRVDVQRHRPRGAGALRGDGPRAGRQVAVVPVEEAVVGEGERLR